MQNTEEVKKISEKKINKSYNLISTLKQFIELFLQIKIDLINYYFIKY